MTKFVPEQGWGPNAKRAALSITFDNFGEAAWLEMGLWGDQKVGEHYTAKFLPALIEALGDVRATYFMEASNAEIYPDAIRSWQAAGHEVGLHAWRHEMWDKTAPAQRRDILRRAIAAMRAIGVEPVGFRPPGGAVPAAAWAEFEEAGLSYCSGLGEHGIERFGDVLSLPFAWRNVDAYMIEALAKPLRLAFGDQEAAYDLDTWRDALDQTIDQAIVEGGQRTIIFHPEFLAESDEKFAVVRTLIARAREADVWIAPARDVARFVNDAMGAVKEPA